MITALIQKKMNVPVKVVVSKLPITEKYTAEAFINGASVAHTITSHKTEIGAANAVINALERGNSHD